MLKVPLQPFHPPTSVQTLLPGGVSLGNVGIALLAIVFILWAIYTAVAVYHWIRYSHASLVATPAIAAHVSISIALMLFALSGTLSL